MLKSMLRSVRPRPVSSSLADVVQQDGPLPAWAVAELFAAVSAALAPMHSAGHAFGDLRASRVEVARGFRIRLTGASAPTAALMDLDVLEGTPHYLAPERILQGEATPATDVYALGALLYFASTGQHAFPGRTPVEICEGHLYGSAPSVPGPLGVLIAAMLRKTPDARPTLAECFPSVAA